MTSHIALCTDSSAQLPPQLAAELGVHVVPVPIAIDGVGYEEGRTLDPDWFCERLLEGARATTSQPSPAAFARAYAALAAEGAELVVSIHMDGRASGTVQSASLAAADAAVPVVVVDSGTASFGVSICVLEAQRTLQQGGSADDAAADVARLAPTIENAFVAPQARGGRVPAEPRNAIFSFAGGDSRQLGAVDELIDASAVIAAHIGRRSSVHTAVGHAARQTEAYADELACLLGGIESVASVQRYRVGPSIAAHTGPISFGAFCWPAQ